MEVSEMTVEQVAEVNNVTVEEVHMYLGAGDPNLWNIFGYLDDNGRFTNRKEFERDTVERKRVDAVEAQVEDYIEQGGVAEIANANFTKKSDLSTDVPSRHPETMGKVVVFNDEEGGRKAIALDNLAYSNEIGWHEIDESAGIYHWSYYSE